MMPLPWDNHLSSFSCKQWADVAQCLCVVCTATDDFYDISQACIKGNTKQLATLVERHHRASYLSTTWCKNVLLLVPNKVASILARLRSRNHWETSSTQQEITCSDPLTLGFSGVSHPVGWPMLAEIVRSHHLMLQTMNSQPLKYVRQFR